MDVGFEISGDVAVLTLSAPPANPLVTGMRRALLAALDRAVAADEVRAILLTGNGPSFCEGADLGEYTRPPETPTLAELCLAVETCAKPVLAVLHGAARGPGLELALAAHYRIADPATRLAMPEVSLGLVPEGGATQRLPRLLGAEASLSLLLNPRGIVAGDKVARKLVDATFGGDRMTAGQAFLRKLLDEGRGPRPTSERRDGFAEPMAYQAAVAAASDETEKHPETARREVVRAIEAAQLLPFDVGLAFEAEIARERRDSRQSRALRHLFQAERRAARPARAAGGLARPVQSVGLVGGGVRALGLAVLALSSGRRAILHAPNAELAERFLDQLAQHAQSTGGGGMAGWRDRIEVPSDLGALAGAQLVIETTGADPAPVAELLSRIGAMTGAEVPLCTTRHGPAGLDIAGRMSADHAARLCLLALRDPVHLARLVELSAPETTGKDILATTIAALTGLGRAVAFTAPHPFPVGLELWRAWQAMALSLADHGVHPHTVDLALRAHGFAAGPFMAMDAEGLQVVRNGLHAAGLPVSRTLDALIAAGREGRKGTRGLYLYPEGAPVPVPDDSLTADLPVPPRVAMPDHAIVHLANAAMANRGSALLRQGVVERPADLDVAMVAGWGYPRLRGGPMKSADLAGLFSYQRLLEQLSDAIGEPAWQPDPHLRDMVKNGWRFTER